MSETTGRLPRARDVRCVSVGAPVAISALARMLWQIHMERQQRPALQLVHPKKADDESRDPVLPLVEG